MTGWITKKEKPKKPKDWITKKEKPKDWITKKKKTTPWITKKKKTTPWITKKKDSTNEQKGVGTLKQTPRDKQPDPRTQPIDRKHLSRQKYNIGGRANLLEEMGRIDARRHPDAADRAEKRRVIGELNKGYKHGKRVKKRGGGLSQVQQHYLQHGYGPHKSSGKVLKGKKVGIQIK
jgi:hypothetical protein